MSVWWTDVLAGALFLAWGIPWVRGMREPGGRPTRMGKFSAWSFTLVGALSVISGIVKLVASLI